MAAQTVKMMPISEAQRLVAGGIPLRPGTYALRSQGVTVTVQNAGNGMAKVIIVKGCDC